MSYDIDELHPVPRAWIRRAQIPKRFLGWSIDDVLPDVAFAAPSGPVSALDDGRVGRWLKTALSGSHGGRGLFLVGAPGQGKTTLAAVLLQEIARHASTKGLGHTAETPQHNPVLFTTYSGLLESRKRMFSLPEDGDEWAYLDLFQEAALGSAGHGYDAQFLVLDDVGKEHSTASRFAEDSLDFLLRSRFDRGLPTIVTTNLPLAEWDSYGESMSSFAREAFVHAVILNRKGDRRR